MVEIVVFMILSHQPVEPFVEGMASYYTVASSSQVTASGEPMRDTDYTCAMRQGAFGDHFLVVAENGRSVICRLNDRGPYVAGRVIDLSEPAMKALGAPGLVRVKVYRLGKTIPPFLLDAQ